MLLLGYLSLTGKEIFRRPAWNGQDGKRRKVLLIKDKGRQPEKRIKRQKMDRVKGLLLISRRLKIPFQSGHRRKTPTAAFLQILS